MTCRPAWPIAALSVELNRLDSAGEVPPVPRGPTRRQRASCRCPAAVCTTTYCAPAAFSLPTCVARSSAACATAACTCACVIWPVDEQRELLEDVVAAALDLVERVADRAGPLARNWFTCAATDRSGTPGGRSPRRVDARAALRVVVAAGERRRDGDAAVLADVHRRDETRIGREARAVLPGVAQAVAEDVSVCKLRGRSARGKGERERAGDAASDGISAWCFSSGVVAFEAARARS